MFRVFKRYLQLSLALFGVLCLAGCPRPASVPKKAPPLAEGKLPTITVIAGGTESYWNEARRGALAAGKQFNANIIWKAPSGKNKKELLKSQQKLMEAAIDNSQGIVAAPIDSTKMMRFFRKVALAGLPAVAFNRDVYTVQNKLTFVHNDEAKSAALKSQGHVVQSDYYQMAYQSVKAILDFRELNYPPREIKIAPIVISKEKAKA